ncbi:MAG TPA: M20/M25/M40 family metallo-hydrolase, partial [Chroococcales cyanobacterium]
LRAGIRQLTVGAATRGGPIAGLISVIAGLVTLTILAGTASHATPAQAARPLPQGSSAEALREELQERLKKHVTVLSSQIGARSLTRSPKGLEKAAQYIESSFIELGYSPQAQRFDVNQVNFLDQIMGGGGGQCRNISVTIAGSGKEAERVVIVGAHYDSVYDCPAADDNASGVASLLEIARDLHERKPGKTIILVAFVNEEPPFFRTDAMGSRHFAQSLFDRQVKVDAMLSLETIGYFTDRHNSQKYPPGLDQIYPKVGNFIAFVSNSANSALTTECVTSFRQAVKFPCEGMAAPNTVRGIDFSDQQSFWKLGYPGLMVTDTAFMRYPYYHTKSDTLDKIDFTKLALVTAGLIGVVEHLSK